MTARHETSRLNQRMAKSTGTSSGRRSAWDDASILSKVTFSVASGLLRIGSVRPLQQSDLDPLPSHDEVSGLAARLGECWTAERQCDSPSLWRALYFTFKGEFWVAALWCLLESVFRIAQPLLLGVLIRWLESPGAAVGAGYGIALGLIACSLGQAIVHHLLYYWTMRAGWNCRMASSAMLHAKALRLSGEALERVTPGHAVNLLSNDVLRFDNFLPALHFLWSAPLDTLVVFVLIALEVGFVAALAGTSVVLLFLPLQLAMGRLFSRQRAKTAALTDTRVRLCGDVFSVPQSVKAFRWEDAVRRLIGAARDEERGSLFATKLFSSASLTLYFAAPCLSSLFTFMAVFLQGEELNVATVFSTLSLIHVLRLSVGKNWCRAVQSGAEAISAVARLRSFLMLDEVIPRSPEPAALRETDSGEAQPPNVVVDAPGGFWWSEPGEGKSGTRALGPLQLSLPSGALVIVCAPCGAGKTALLKALLGELAPVEPTTASGASGAVRLRGLCGYAAQRPWIFSGSLRDNVVFGRHFKDEQWRFERVLTGCALDGDVASLVDGADTEIGEQGINLSGGQRARVALARALYANPRVVLLDDPIAAVDARVGAHIMRTLSCRRDSANGKESGDCDALLSPEATVVLVTHHVEWLLRGPGSRNEEDNAVVRVLLLGEGGTLLGYGTPSEMRDSGKLDDVILAMQRNGNLDANRPSKRARKASSAEDDTLADVKTCDGGDETTMPSSVQLGFEAAVNENGTRSSSESISTDSATSDEVAEVKQPADRVELVLPEARSIGRVTWRTYLSYLRAGGNVRFALSMSLFVGAQACALYSDWYLKGWADKSKDERSDDMLLDYALITVGAVVLGLARAIVFFRVGLVASTKLHDAAFHRVLRAPLWWFTANPLGRILNKFTSDLGQVDELLPEMLFDCLQNAMLVAGAVVLCCISIPWMTVALVPLGYLFRRIRAYFLASSRELKRLEAISKSPVFSAFSAHIAGLDTIRAFDGAQERLHSAFIRSLDRTARCWYSWLLVNRWVGFRLDMVSLCVLAFVSIGPVVRVSAHSIRPLTLCPRVLREHFRLQEFGVET